MNEKTLLIFYGEYRSFDTIIPQLKNLDKVDIIFSTWDYSTNGCAIGKVEFYKEFKLESTNIDFIQKKFPNLKLIVSDYTSYESNHIISKIIYHWKTAINSIDDDKKYDKVFIHRCDMVSNWDIILNKKLEDSIYLHTKQNEKLEWLNDMFLFGKYSIIKNFINLIDIPNKELKPYEIHTTILANTINKHKLKWIGTNEIVFRLVRFYLESFFKKLTNKNINYIYECDDKSDEYKELVMIHNQNTEPENFIEINKNNLEM